MAQAESVNALDIVGVDNYTVGHPGAAASAVGPGKPTAPAGWPDTTLDAAQVAGLDIRAASIRGLIHRYEGTPRQDSYSVVWQDELAALILTVCDGIGSLPQSHEAAELVAQRTAAALTRDPGSGELQWARAFGAALPEIALRIAGGKRMATTVVSACITATGDGAHRAELAWIGDSAAYLLKRESWRTVGGSVKAGGGDGDPMVTSTRALPSSLIEVQTSTVEFEPGDALFLMTDGVADPLGTGNGEVGEALASWWASPPDRFSFAAQVDFARRSFDDDRTVIGVWAARQGGEL